MAKNRGPPAAGISERFEQHGKLDTFWRTHASRHNCSGGSRTHAELHPRRKGSEPRQEDASARQGMKNEKKKKISKKTKRGI